MGSGRRGEGRGIGGAVAEGRGMGSDGSKCGVGKGARAVDNESDRDGSMEVISVQRIV